MGTIVTIIVYLIIFKSFYDSYKAHRKWRIYKKEKERLENMKIFEKSMLNLVVDLGVCKIYTFKAGIRVINIPMGYEEKIMAHLDIDMKYNRLKSKALGVRLT